MRLWGGRFGGEAGDADEAERIAAFGRSVEIDRELALDDLDGSIAHVRGLGRAGILTDDEAGTLVAATSKPAPSNGTRASRTSI
jgi:argininosuccinate lyase